MPLEINFSIFFVICVLETIVSFSSRSIKSSGVQK